MRRAVPARRHRHAGLTARRCRHEPRSASPATTPPGTRWRRPAKPTAAPAAVAVACIRSRRRRRSSSTSRRTVSPRARSCPVESEHSAMAVCIGASIDGARAFTASSSNGLLYMTENVFAAGYYRLPIVMVASNRTLGPPWNIWVDQGDTLALRDAAVAAVLLRVAPGPRGHDPARLPRRRGPPRSCLPVLVAQDGFILSHTQMVVDLPEQALGRPVPAGACTCRTVWTTSAPRTYGGMTWPRDTERQREEIAGRHGAVPAVLAEAIDEFEEVFGRRPARRVHRRAHRRRRDRPRRLQHDDAHRPARGREPPGERREGRPGEGEALPPVPP